MGRILIIGVHKYAKTCFKGVLFASIVISCCFCRMRIRLNVAECGVVMAVGNGCGSVVVEECHHIVVQNGLWGIAA